MNKTRTYLACLALAGAAFAAQAGVTFTPTVVSDYDFRGIAQSAKKPALQASVDWSGGPFHLGAWTSNMDFEAPTKFFGDKHTEVDLSADYSFGSDETAHFNTGLVYYVYPGQTEIDTPEVWFVVTKGWFSANLHYSWDWFTASGASSQNEYYAEANGSWPLGKDTGFGFTAHVGYNGGDYFKTYYKEYTDYGIGLTKSLGKFNVALKYVDSDGPTIANPDDILVNDSRVILSVSTTFPWTN